MTYIISRRGFCDLSPFASLEFQVLVVILGLMMFSGCTVDWRQGTLWRICVQWMTPEIRTSMKGLHLGQTEFIVNPLVHMRSEGYGTWFVSMSVIPSFCYRVFCHHAQRDSKIAIPTGSFLHRLHFNTGYFRIAKRSDRQSQRNTELATPFCYWLHYNTSPQRVLGTEFISWFWVITGIAASTTFSVQK